MLCCMTCCVNVLVFVSWDINSSYILWEISHADLLSHISLYDYLCLYCNVSFTSAWLVWHHVTRFIHLLVQPSAMFHDSCVFWVCLWLRVPGMYLSFSHRLHLFTYWLVYLLHVFVFKLLIFLQHICRSELKYLYYSPSSGNKNVACYQ